MIWDLNLTGSGKVWDVTDLAPAPEDCFLASTGLDFQVMIWVSAGTLWVNSSLPSLTTTLCTFGRPLTGIWRRLEATIPFEHSPGSTFFRRLSWFSDGAHITAPSATNNNGYKFTAAVISHNTRMSNISLIGYENTFEVACYNLHIFLHYFFTIYLMCSLQGQNIITLH
ncbi:HIR1_7 [Sanghuangporus weigelae]